jgi:ubiquinone/menaquinone biosynthesis C-methylase UbiE
MIDHPVRGRFNAWLLAVLDGYMHWKYADIKSGLFEKAPSVIVELGPGPGTNLRYLPRGTKLIAIESNRHMHKLLDRHAKKFGIELDLRGLAGEQLDLQSKSVDFVFSSLVLCTVEHPDQVIAEVLRILKPGGRFVCIEHVEAPTGSAIQRLQNVIKRPWKWLFEGCDLCRHTAQTLRFSGFAKVEIKPFIMPTLFIPIRHQITAICIK